MSFTAYPEYKKLTFQALGCIPGHWSVVRFKQVYQEINERSEIGAEELLSVSEYYGVKPRSEKIQDGEHLTRAESLEGYKKCKPGDLVMNIMLAWKRGLGISNYAGIVSPAYAVFRNITRVEPRYFHYLLRTDEYIGYFKAYSAGVIDSRLRLYPEVFSRLVAITPPLGEQTQIARFLDHETAKIDALIAEQKRLIKLLQEKLHSLILSDIKNHNLPEERLQHLVDVVRRPVTQLPDEDYVALGLFNRGRGLFHKPAKKRDEMGDSDFFWIKQGDLIISGQFAWEGAVAMATELETGKVVSHRYPVIRGRRGGILTEYLFALLTTSHGDFLLNENSRGAAGRNRPLNLNSLLKEKIKIPSISKQELVANLVHRVNQVKLETQMQKELLLERRSTLISAVVTGKIDVRVWQPPADESAFDEDVRKAGMEASA